MIKISWRKMGPIITKIKQFDFRGLPGRMRETLVVLAKSVAMYSIFITLLLLYVLRKIWMGWWHWKIIGKVADLLHFGIVVKGIDRLIDIVDNGKTGDVSRIYLIELSFKNMKSKKTRAMVTIGGVAVGVGAIVFLVSLGYGLERMVIGRVAKLDELRVVDVGIGEGTNVKMNEEMVKRIGGINGVSEVIPVVSMVSKVKYKNSIIDMMTLGVDERYLRVVNAKIAAGKGLTGSEEVGMISRGGQVAGVSSQRERAVAGDRVNPGLINFNVVGGDKMPIWKEADSESEVLGYLIRSEGGYWGEELWGARYYIGDNELGVGMDPKTGKELSRWVRAKLPLWRADEASDRVVPVLDDSGRQKWEIGWVMDLGLQKSQTVQLEYGDIGLDEYLYGGEVLGVSTSVTAVVATPSADLFETVVATDSAGVEWVEVKRVGDDPNKIKEIKFLSTPALQAWASKGMIKMFGMTSEKAVGEKFKVSYIIPGSMLTDVTGRMQSEEVEYTIAGIVDDETANYYYFHLADAKRLGVKNYSQLKVVAKTQTQVPEIRKNIESMGLRTNSTLDTVAEIEKLFRTLRMVLGLLGTIALAVAGLGMFNTMTVSLLERTREVGVMKAMGMLSTEVKELFLAESMIMGFGGGVLGVLLGWGGGQLLSLVLSSVSVVKGQAMINISYVPFFFVAFILLVSFMVGVVTGWYPSKRATTISALNALRYE